MAACLYQENRVSLQPADPSAVESIFVPSTGSSAFGLRDYPKRRRIESPALNDEAGFTQHHLATEASIYFRPDANAYPRSVLWRMLDGNQLLELQSVDLYNVSRAPQDAAVTLRIRFDNPLAPQGIVFASTTEPTSAVIVHAVTQKGEIVTLTLKDEVFTRANSLEEGQGASKWWQTHSPSALKIRQSFRLVTWNRDKELFITLNDGSVVRLHRSNTEPWKESIFSESTWTSSMRGLFRSHPSVRYGNADMDAKAACSAALSPTGSLLWTVCLDHTVRVWSTVSGKVVHSFDLAGRDRDLNDPVSQLLDPHANGLVQVIKMARHRAHYLLAAYSPIARLFKIWSIEEIDEGSLKIDDYNPEFSFQPPIDDLIETVGWQLVNFNLKTPQNEGDRQWTLWILVRSGSAAHIFTIRFDPDGQSQKLNRTWHSQWARAHTGFASLAALKAELDHVVTLDDKDNATSGDSVIERWLTWLLRPGLFSEHVLETALAVYAESQSRRLKRGKADAASRETSFSNRLSIVINNAIPTLAFDEDTHFVDHERQVVAQIKFFNGILEDLQRNREKALALAFDHQLEMPWLVMADQTSAIRSCCDLEILHHNHHGYRDQHSFAADTLLLRSLTTASTSSVGVVVDALRVLHESLSHGFFALIRENVYADTLRPSATTSIENRIQMIYDASSFEGQISDEIYDHLSKCFEQLGGWKYLDDDTFAALLDLFGQDDHGRSQQRQLAPYGARSLIRGAQDTLQLERELLMDLIVLLIFMSCELHQEDLSESLTTPIVYENALSLVKERMVLSWAAFSQHISKPLSDKPFSEQASASSHEAVPITVLQKLFIGDWADMKTPKAAAVDLLLYWCRAWTFGAHIMTDYENKIPYIMSKLLRTSSTRLAGSFVSFMPSTPWSKYVCGRYYMMAGDFDEATRLFDSIAEDLGTNFNVAQYDSEGLLAPDEKSHFGDGLPRFYLHLVNLFEKVEAYSHVGAYASLALTELESEGSHDLNMKRHLTSRLFAASMQTSRFEDAFTALTKQDDIALRRQSLSEFLNSILSTSSISTLLHLSWPNELANDADTQLTKICSKPDSLAASQYSGSSLEPNSLGSDASPIPPHRLLYAWRIQRNNYRGAATALWERVQILKLAQAQGLRGKDVDAELEAMYLSLINCLVLVDEKMRWLLVRPVELSAPGQDASTSETNEDIKRGPRQIVTVDDVRREYQALLDRMSDLAAGRYPMPLQDDAEDDEEDEIMEIDGDTGDKDVQMRGALMGPGVAQGMPEVDVFAG
ncbi:MAG: hypothetical protein Q9162_006862 [Coniocarpon cinnabarinum]